MNKEYHMSTTNAQTGLSKKVTQAPELNTDPVPVMSERIRARAYEIYQARSGNGGPGDQGSDWLQAERELNGGSPVPQGSLDIQALDIQMRSQARAATRVAGRE